MKYSFSLLMVCVLTLGCSKPTESTKIDTLFLENNGFKLVFNDKGLEVTNSNGEYLIFDSEGLKISNPSAFGKMTLYNNEGKILVNMYERDYPNNRGKGGEVAAYSSYNGQYEGLNLAVSIEKNDAYFMQRIEALESRNSQGSSVGKVCLSCAGRGIRNPGGLGIKNCSDCDGTGRIFD